MITKLNQKLNEKIAALVKPKVVTRVGLDIGSYSVKCVEIIQDDKKVGLRSAQIKRLASNSADNLRAALRAIRLGLSSPIKHIRISVSGPSVLIRNVTLPRMTPQELKSAIRFEAERHIPFQINECAVDYQVIGQTSDKVSMKVLLIVAKKDFIDQQLKALSDCDLEPEIIDSDIFCFANAFEKLADDSQAKTYGLLNIGHSLSSFATIHDKQIFFVRETPFGGLGVTKALAEFKKIPEEAAEDKKKRREPELLPDLFWATQKGFEPLVEEMKRSIDYFENEAGEELKEIYIAGGGARSQGACEVLSEELGRKVQLWDKIKKTDIIGHVEPKFLEEHFAELNVAFGLALRGTGQNR